MSTLFDLATDQQRRPLARKPSWPGCESISTYDRNSLTNKKRCPNTGGPGARRATDRDQRVRHP